MQAAQQLTRTLEQLEGASWPEPIDPTPLVENVHRLRRVPLGELSDDNLRLLLLQGVGAKWLAPLALERLEQNPLAGDL